MLHETVQVKPGIDHYSEYNTGMVTRIVNDDTVEVTFLDRTETFGVEELDLVSINWSLYIS